MWKRNLEKKPFRRASKRIIYLGINHWGENVYTENCKTIMKETEETKMNGKVSHVHWFKN